MAKRIMKFYDSCDLARQHRFQNNSWVLQTKVDGIRASVQEGKLLTASLKEVPNVNLQKIFALPQFEGLDGELVECDADNKPLSLNVTKSTVMSKDKIPGNLIFFVFDSMALPDLTYVVRLLKIDEVLEAYGNTYPIRSIVAAGKTALVKGTNYSAIREALANQFDQPNTDGFVLRNAYSKYVHGRSTIRGEEGFKIKNRIDNEAVVIGYELYQENYNEPYINEQGLQKRSSSQDGKVTRHDMLGAFVCQDPKTGARFNIGTGLTRAQRVKFLALIRESARFPYLVTYTCLGYTEYGVPREPSFKSLREIEDTTDY